MGPKSVALDELWKVTALTLTNPIGSKIKSRTVYCPAPAPRASTDLRFHTPVLV